MTTTAIDICLCTFRRPHLEATLRSLAALVTKPEWNIRVIVADNDETPSAQPLAQNTAAATGLNLLYIHAPARNISIARNACLDAATAPLIAFIDDDEIATPEWLMVLVSTLQSSQSSIVLGPVQAIYADSAPAWMKQGNFHATLPVWENGQIITGYTCNVIFRKEAIGSLRFRLELGRSGGEDTDFFTQLHQAGHRIAYAPEALLVEDVPPERAQLSWLLKRRFRVGQTHATTLLQDHPHSAPRTVLILRALATIAICFGISLATLFKPSRAAFWALRGTMHIGVLSRLLGKQEITQYG